MKQFLLLVLLVFFFLTTNAQRDTIIFSAGMSQKAGFIDAAGVNVNIYPVPVIENSFTIKSDKEISAIKITNIIGQDIYRVKYNNPMLISKIILDNPRRGMYLVVIIFSDYTRIVKKIMIEESE
jgi:Secretion system C-terminal sorting domain